MTALVIPNAIGVNTANAKVNCFAAHLTFFAQDSAVHLCILPFPGYFLRCHDERLAAM